MFIRFFRLDYSNDLYAHFNNLFHPVHFFDPNTLFSAYILPLFFTLVNILHKLRKIEQIRSIDNYDIATGMINDQVNDALADWGVGDEYIKDKAR